MKRICISVSNDLASDQRVRKISQVLHEMGFKVTLLGRCRQSSPDMGHRPYRVRRFRLLFNKGPLFYACLNMRLFFFLLFHRTDALLANDLDTLLPNFMVSRLKGKPLVYDSHELFPESAELRNRRLVKSIWKFIEKTIMPRLKYVMTVNDSIARIYSLQYKIKVKAVRNISEKQKNILPLERKELGMDNTHIIVLQGSGINFNRGAEEALQAMFYMNNAMLFIIGDGLAVPTLKQLAKKKGIVNKVAFFNRMPYEEMMQYTAMADLGLCLDKDVSLNHRYSLPNKLFDYIQAGVPILASDLPETGRIVRNYGIGELIKSHNPGHIAGMMKMMLGDKDKQIRWKSNLQKAADELNWDNEKKKIISFYQNMLYEEF